MHIEMKDSDKKMEECIQFIDSYCLKDIKTHSNKSLNITISLKETGSRVAFLEGFSYDYKTESCISDKKNAFHIKKIYVEDEYDRRRIGTYLMEQAISFAERNKYKYMSTHPYADTRRISQEDLEKFYKSFTFRCDNYDKEIEFKKIDD